MPRNSPEDDQPSAAERLERARWRSRRGLLELELLLKPFVDGGFAGLPETLKQDYERLLECDDMDAHEWLLARSEPPADLKDLISEIRVFLDLD
jgi:antitoxin CptB